jgi:hypothetical protein
MKWSTAFVAVKAAYQPSCPYQGEALFLARTFLFVLKLQTTACLASISCTSPYNRYRRNVLLLSSLLSSSL